MSGKFLLLFLLLFIPKSVFCQKDSSELRVGVSIHFLGVEAFNLSNLNKALSETNYKQVNSITDTRALCMYFEYGRGYMGASYDWGSTGGVNQQDPRPRFSRMSYNLAFGYDFPPKGSIGFSPYISLNFTNYSFDLGNPKGGNLSFNQMLHDSMLNTHIESTNNGSAGLGLMVYFQMKSLIFRPLRYRFFANMGVRQTFISHSWVNSLGQAIPDFPVKTPFSEYLNFGIMLF